jgi:hypothetical protein
MAHPLVDQLRAASADRTPLRTVGGDTKRFYGRPVNGTVLSVAGHSGIVRYDPAELVITARAGTSLAAIESAMRARGQMLAFEPPHFGTYATLGGCVGCDDREVDYDTYGLSAGSGGSSAGCTSSPGHRPRSTTIDRTVGTQPPALPVPAPLATRPKPSALAIRTRSRSARRRASTTSSSSPGRWQCRPDLRA